MAELSTQTAASALAGTELVPVDQSGFKKATVDQIRAYANAAVVDRCPWVAGRFYSYREGVIGTGTALSANLVYFVPVILPFTVSADQLLFYVATAGAASTVGYGAIFLGNASTSRPTGTALGTSSASFAVDSTGMKTTSLNTTVQMSGGQLYFVAVTSTGAPALRVFNTGGVNGMSRIGLTSAVMSSSEWIISTGETAGTWTDVTAKGAQSTNNSFEPMFRAA